MKEEQDPSSRSLRLPIIKVDVNFNEKTALVLFCASLAVLTLAILSSALRENPGQEEQLPTEAPIQYYDECVYKITAIATGSWPSENSPILARFDYIITDLNQRFPSFARQEIAGLLIKGYEIAPAEMNLYDYAFLVHDVVRSTDIKGEASDLLATVAIIGAMAQATETDDNGTEEASNSSEQPSAVTDLVRVGMSVSEVEDIIGEAGDSVASSDQGDCLGWHVAGITLFVWFQDGKAIEVNRYDKDGQKIPSTTDSQPASVPALPNTVQQVP